MLGANDSITLKAIITIGLISGISVCTSAQSIIDWVLDPAGTATNYVIGEARKQANNAWEGFLDDNIKESLSEDAQKLANYSIDSTALDSIDKIFGMRTYGDGQFEEITKRQKQLIGSYLFCSNKMPIGLIGNGIIRKKIINKIESIQYPTHQITSIELLQYNHPEIAELRLLWNGTSIKDDAKVLYYWAVLANRLDSLYPKKISFPKPQQLSMNSAIDINPRTTISTEGGQLLGDLSSRYEIIVRDATLLNMAAMPNAVYYVGEVEYKTDYLGRVLSVSCQIFGASKQKSPINGKVSASKIMPTYRASKGYKPFVLIPQKYGGAIGRLNIVPVEQTPDNKKQQKALLKQIKQTSKYCKKNGYYIVHLNYDLKYVGRNECPSTITASLDGQHFFLLNDHASQLAKIQFSFAKEKQPLALRNDGSISNEGAKAPSLEKIKAGSKEYNKAVDYIVDFQKPKRFVSRELSPKSNEKITNNKVRSQNYYDESEDVVFVESPDETESEEDVVFVVVEQMPEFPGGQQGLFRFLCENVKYPVIAQESGIQGRVICEFVVNKDGSISDIKVIRSGGDASLDKEAVRVIKAMPKWKPGMQRGKPVRVKYTVPVHFKLQ